MLTSDQAFRFFSQVNMIDIGLFTGSIVTIALIVTGIRRLSDWISKKFPSKRMIIFEWIPILNFLLYFGGIFSAFYIIFEPRREFLIAFMVSSFVAIGFAIKDLVASIIGGIVLLMDRPFQVGDRISFQDYYGEILRIGLRSVKILTLDESIVTIPNQRFISEGVSSSSAGELGMMTTVDVYVPQEVDLYKVKDLLQKEAKKNPYVDSRKKTTVVAKETLGINGTVSFIMTVKCILKDARLEKAFQTDFLMDVRREFKRRRLKKG